MIKEYESMIVSSINRQDVETFGKRSCNTSRDNTIFNTVKKEIKTRLKPLYSQIRDYKQRLELHRKTEK